MNPTNPSRAGALVGVVLLAGCAGPRAGGPPEADRPPHAVSPGLVEVLPGVRADPREGIVEFDGEIAVDCHDLETPDVYLEVVCCGRDSREHEALVVTDVAASLVHAALLSVGAEPGHPGGWRREGDRVVPVQPEGSGVEVWILVRGPDGTIAEHAPGSWIRDLKSGRSLSEIAPDDGWVFAGSRVRRFGDRDVYDADGTGQIVGLHTFGSETIAWKHVESPDSAQDDPRWLAIDDRVPPIGTPVTIRLRRLAPASDSR
ncbi:MAG: hypothetical protein IPJ41_13660 [Phycisphaerales bacterium]|nr:hypothetical protein [Phycisphaerales bacterium]